jgi:hypothetical protein
VIPELEGEMATARLTATLEAKMRWEETMAVRAEADLKADETVRR